MRPYLREEELGTEHHDRDGRQDALRAYRPERRPESPRQPPHRHPAQSIDVHLDASPAQGNDLNSPPRPRTSPEARANTDPWR